MPLRPSDLTVGRCYLRRDGQVVSVESLGPRQVVVRPRQGGPGRRVWAFSEPMPLPRFLAEFEREVPCDHEPGA